MIVVALSNDIKAIKAVSALVRAMYNLALVAIVRYKRTEDSNPVIGAMFPKIKKCYDCLDFTQLPFAEDIREWSFPVLPVGADKNRKTSETYKAKDIPSNHQLSLIDKLIDTMDLMQYGPPDSLTE